MILHYKTYGESSAPALCIMHGLFGSLDNWHNVARHLSKQFYVVSMDLRNHGSSAHTDAMSYTLMADDVAETCASIGISEAHFIGHSMGGKVVMNLTENHPSLVTKVIVVDIAPKRYKPGHLHLFDAMFSIDFSKFQSRGEIEDFLSPAIPDQSVRLFLLKNIQRNGTSYSWKLNLPAILSNYNDIIDAQIPAWPMTVPALFVKGDKSNYIVPSDESEILDWFPLAQFATVENAGHWVHADNPSGFEEIALSFLLS